MTLRTFAVYHTCMDQTINIRIPRALYNRHKRLRKLNELSVAAQIRLASKEYLARNEALEKRVDSVLNKQEKR